MSAISLFRAIFVTRSTPELNRLSDEIRRLLRF